MTTEIPPQILEAWEIADKVQRFDPSISYARFVEYGVYKTLQAENQKLREALQKIIDDEELHNPTKYFFSQYFCKAQKIAKEALNTNKSEG